MSKNDNDPRLVPITPEQEREMWEQFKQYGPYIVTSPLTFIDIRNWGEPDADTDGTRDDKERS